MTAYHVKVKRKNVNSDIFAKTLEDQLMESALFMDPKELSDVDNREAFVDGVNYLLMRAVHDGKIINFKVTMDKRNNKRVDMQNGNFRLDIFYQQKNCLNTTCLTFLFSEEEEYKTLTY